MDSSLWLLWSSFSGLYLQCQAVIFRMAVDWKRVRDIMEGFQGQRKRRQGHAVHSKVKQCWCVDCLFKKEVFPSLLYQLTYSGVFPKTVTQGELEGLNGENDHCCSLYLHIKVVSIQHMPTAIALKQTRRLWSLIKTSTN